MGLATCGSPVYAECQLRNPQQPAYPESTFDLATLVLEKWPRVDTNTQNVSCLMGTKANPVLVKVPKKDSMHVTRSQYQTCICRKILLRFLLLQHVQRNILTQRAIRQSKHNLCVTNHGEQEKLTTRIGHTKWLRGEGVANTIPASGRASIQRDSAEKVMASDCELQMAIIPIKTRGKDQVNHKKRPSQTPDQHTLK